MEGNTRLHIAVVSGNIEPVKFLLENGSNIEEKNLEGNTPLHIALESNNEKMIKFLIEIGSNIEEKNFEGNTPLHIAVATQNEKLMKFLVESGCNLEEKNLKGNTPIHIALESNNEKMIKFLIEIGSNIEEKNLEGNTPLHIAVATQNEKLLQFLVESGCNIVEKNLEGNTPLHIAAASDNDKIVKYLIQNGASSTQFTKNDAGQIPYEVAKHNNYIFRITLIDFLDFALKSSKFSSNEFQKQLGSEVNLFCLKRDFDGNKTLLEFLNDKGMIKEREEVIQLLIKIDYFRYKNSEDKSKSKRRIIKILRAGIKPSRGLKESIDSVQQKYSWETGKIVVKCGLSILHNIVFGWGLYASDVFSDVYFYNGLDQSNNTNTTTNNNNSTTRIVTLVHIILPFLCSFLLFFTMLYSKMEFNCFLLMKLPLSPVTKSLKTLIECRSFINNKNMEDANYGKQKTDLIAELEDQKTITTISMINEATMESSFQFLFQGLFSLPTLVFSFKDLYDGDMKMTDLVNWKIVSIILSFLTFAFTSFNISYILS